MLCSATTKKGLPCKNKAKKSSGLCHVHYSTTNPYTPDYHYFTTKSTSKEERKKLYVGDLWINATTCHLCNETIRSKNRHDFKYCKCGSVAVDGGSWYAKRSYKEGAKFTDHIELFDDVDK